MRWRWWTALPVAVVLVLVASASRLHLFWWPHELHEETSGRQLQPVTVVDRWTDADDREHERRFTVTLVDVRPATSVEGFSGREPVEPPPGVAVWQVVLEFEVDPDVPMGLCRVSLIDNQGRESDADGGTVGDAFLPATACEPENRKGPDYAGDRDPDALPRLPTYRVGVYAVTADDVVPASVRLSWEPPDYVEIEVSER
jgi:hypothetical protein